VSFSIAEGSLVGFPFGQMERENAGTEDAFAALLSNVRSASVSKDYSWSVKTELSAVSV